jgi:hypothetical protein
MHTVILHDNKLNWDEAKLYFSTINRWAIENCSSYKGYEVQDVTDVSDLFDQVASYQFESDADQVWFKLRWAST